MGAVKEITNGKGADLFFECSGNAHAFKDLLPAVKKGGQVILVGLYPEEISFGLNTIVTNELEVKGTWTSGVFTDWARTIALVEAGQVKMTPLISHRFPLEGWEEIVNLMEQGACIKAIFTMS